MHIFISVVPSIIHTEIEDGFHQFCIKPKLLDLTIVVPTDDRDTIYFIPGTHIGTG